MNVVFVEPFFPRNQREFARALAEAGATVIGIGEYGYDGFDADLKSWLSDYEQVPSVTDVAALTDAVRNTAPLGALRTTIEYATTIIGGLQRGRARLGG